MVCFFCIVVLAAVAASLVASGLEALEARLEAAAAGPLRRTVDSDSVVRFETEWAIGKKRTGVVITVFKQTQRARIQILSHSLTRAEAAQVEDQIATALEATVVERSNPSDEQLVRAALDPEHEHAPIDDPALRTRTSLDDASDLS